MAASAVAAAVDVAGLVALVEGGHVAHVPSAIISYIAGGFVNYALCAVWVFPHRPPNATLGLTAFMALSLVGLGITAVAIHVLVGIAGLHYILAKGVALALAFAWNFSSRKWLIFRRRR
ncbi:MAG: GtrA family protein [Armatimonadota bacterium]